MCQAGSQAFQTFPRVDGAESGGANYGCGTAHVLTHVKGSKYIGRAPLHCLRIGYRGFVSHSPCYSAVLIIDFVVVVYVGFMIVL